MKCNQSRPGFELVSPSPFPTTITITPWTPPFWAPIINPSVSTFRLPLFSHRLVFIVSISVFLLRFVHVAIFVPKLITLVLSYIITLCEVFNTSVSWWSFIGVWVGLRFIGSPGHFSVFSPISMVPSIGYFQFVLQILTLPVPFPCFRGPFLVHQLLLVSPSGSCPTGFLILSQGPRTYVSFCFFLVFTLLSIIILLFMSLSHWRQQVSSSLQDSSQYSGRCEQCCTFGWSRFVYRFLTFPIP